MANQRNIYFNTSTRNEKNNQLNRWIITYIIAKSDILRDSTQYYGDLPEDIEFILKGINKYEEQFPDKNVSFNRTLP